MKTRIRKTVNQFPVIVHEDELGGYWVECPTLDGCYSQGETLDDALANIREAISLCLEDVPVRERMKVVARDVSMHLVHVT